MKTDYRSLFRGLKKGLYFVENFAKYIVPNPLYNFCFSLKMKTLSKEEKAVMERRASHYMRLPDGAKVNVENSKLVRDYKFPFGEKHKYSAYFFDLYETVRCFNPNYRFHYIFGDVDYETEQPTFVKSRPIGRETYNSVICRLNKVRHFRFIHDRMNYRDKKDMLIFRNVVRKQPQRTNFLKLYAQHPLCDAGQINNDTNLDHPEYHKTFVTLDEQLKYKFIACIEGHDVATNLKWVMSSNSVAVMPRPKIESWFMEGELKGGYHYIELKDDYSDLEEKLNYYIAHPEKAEEIIQHAHEYVNKFRNKKLEQCIQYRVMQKYFEKTNQ